MQRPQESFDDLSHPIEPHPPMPPAPVALRPTGEIEVLSPLELREPSPETIDTVVPQRETPRISWFHRSLIFAGGAVAVIAAIFLSAVFVAINESSESTADVDDDLPAYSSDAPLDTSTVLSDEPATADGLTAASAIASGEFRMPRPFSRTQHAVPRVRQSAYVPRPTPPRPEQEPAFVPTTLIIYPENGEIKTRIEPNLSAAYRPSTF